MIIPNLHPYQAIFRFPSETKLGKFRFEDRPIIAWDDDGDALVPGDYGLVRARDLEGFHRIQESEGKIIAAIPGTGYRAKYKNQDGSFFETPILAWIINEFGQATPITTDSDGCDGSARDSHNFEQILFPEDPKTVEQTL